VSISVSFVTWTEAQSELADIRRRVFVEEQGVPLELEWDGLDESAEHVLAKEHDTALGCARLLPGGKIGRMAILPEARGRGIGHSMLRAILDHLQARGIAEARLSAQTHAIPFYEKCGFTVCSDTYDDAGIPHRDMKLKLSA
jgi:predicted GNAT family N-acyltransferase